MFDTSDRQSALLPPSKELIAGKAVECARITPQGLHVFVGALQEQFGDSLLVVQLYGSCLHSYDLKNSVVDLYAVDDDYHRAYGNSILSTLNRYVPPNVFYLELEHVGMTLRCTYGVISISDFEEGASSWFHSYIWVRFPNSRGCFMPVVRMCGIECI